jgi:hypothetical protein
MPIQRKYGIYFDTKKIPLLYEIVVVRLTNVVQK